MNSICFAEFICQSCILISQTVKIMINHIKFMISKTSLSQNNCLNFKNVIKKTILDLLITKVHGNYYPIGIINDIDNYKCQNKSYVKTFFILIKFYVFFLRWLFKMRHLFKMK